MCLLNIPDMVQKFGPYRNLYEGKFCGEAYNRVLKPCANRSSHRNRATNLLRNLVREKSMEAVQHNFDQGHDPSTATGSSLKVPNRSVIYRKAHRYKNRNKVRLHYDSHFPLSVVIYTESQEEGCPILYGLCYIWRLQLLIYPITKKEESYIHVGLSTKYWNWILDYDTSGHCSIETIVIMDYALLLPLSSDSNRPLGIYYTITTYSHNPEGTVAFT